MCSFDQSDRVSVLDQAIQHIQDLEHQVQVTHEFNNSVIKLYMYVQK